MSENVRILLSESTTPEEKINSANNIIINYNLNLTTEEIMLVFTKARSEIDDPQCSCNFVHHEFLFEYLLNQNIAMFVAIAKYCIELEKKIIRFWILSFFVSFCEPFYVGSNSLRSNEFTVIAYKDLLKYNNFDINNLRMPDGCRKEIQEYRDEKYGGSLTKAAKK